MSYGITLYSMFRYFKIVMINKRPLRFCCVLLYKTLVLTA